MELVRNWGSFKRFVDVNGWDALLEGLGELTGVEYYQVSKGWYEDRQFILKCKGAAGDLIVSWV